MPYLATILSIVLIAANSWHVITQWFINKPHEVFTGIAHYYADYFLYISQIVKAGHMYTNENITPTWIYWFYNTLGLLRGNPFALYNASLVILSGIVLLLIWKICTKIFPKNTLMAFLFVTTASNFPNFSSGLLGDFWFSPTPALNRLGGVPHQIFQTILLFSIVIIFTQRNFKFRLIFLAVLSFLSGSGSPMQMFLLFIAMALYTIISTKKYTDLLIAIPALLGALLTTHEFSTQPILVLAKAWEDAQRLAVSPWQYSMALGPISVLIPFGIRSYIRSLTPLKSIILFYGTLSLLAFFSPLPSLLHTSATRWISPASFLLLPLLAAEGFQRISKFRILQSLLLVTYLTLTMLSIGIQVQSRSIPLASDPMLKFLNHLPTSYVDGLRAIQNDKTNGVVLTDPSIPIDIVVPIFTGKKSFTGQSIHTLYPEIKEDLRTKFFSQKMTSDESKKILTDHNIKFIITKKNGVLDIETVAP